MYRFELRGHRVEQVSGNSVVVIDEDGNPAHKSLTVSADVAEKIVDRNIRNEVGNMLSRMAILA